MTANVEGRTLALPYAGNIGDNGSTEWNILTPLFNASAVLPSDQNCRVSGVCGEVQVVRTDGTSGTVQPYAYFALDAYQSVRATVVSAASALTTEGTLGMPAYGFHSGVQPVNQVLPSGYVPVVRAVTVGASTDVHFHCTVVIYVDLVN